METAQSLLSHLPPWPVLRAWLSSAWLLAALLQAVFVVMDKRSPVATLAWLIVLTLLPVVGLLVYWGFGPQRVKRQRLRRFRGRARLASQAELKLLREERADVPPRTVHHARLIERACGMPVSTATSVTILQDGVCTLRAMLEAIAASKRHIHLEYYIYEPDEIGLQLMAALVERLRAGVKVRLLVDAVGSPRLISRRGRRFLREYLELGGQFEVFHPTRFDRLRPLVNLRSHRKILVCDGRVGFTGGINVTEDENEEVREDAYRDTHVRLEGPVVRWLQLVFLEDWVYARGRRDFPNFDEELHADLVPGAIAVQVIASGPDTDGEAIHRAMNDAFYKAQQRVWLATPYFVPTEASLYALTDAALRGVDVRVLVPRNSDSRIVTAAARSYFDELMRVGIRIYEYQPRMLHAKTLLVDDDYVQIGTANFDHRSFRLNFEVAVAIYDKACCEALAQAFEADLKVSRKVPRDGQPGWLARFEQAVARLLSPLL